jgi:hypothetical protein
MTNFLLKDILIGLNIQRVSEICTTLILTNDSSRQEQQNCYGPFFRNIIFISVFSPYKLTSCLFTRNF